MPLAPLPPGYDKHHIVYLEAIHCALPEFAFDHTVDVYQRTSPSEVRERIRNATIIIATVTPVTKRDLESAPHLQLLAVYATGMAWVDKAYCVQRSITVVNCPQSNIPAVGEHFLALYFACRRKVPELHRRVTETSEWKEKASLASRWPLGPPLSCKQEVLGIMGYGALGRRFEDLAKAVGFGKVIIAERKGVTRIRPGRESFEEVIRTSSTLVICCPRDPDTINLIGSQEISGMRKEALLINMARGGIVNEQDLADALRSGTISGAATDVVDGEPCGLGDSPLIPDVTRGQEPIPNLIISPHIAWYATETIVLLKNLLKDNCDAFVAGKLEGEQVRTNVVVYDGRIWK